MKIEFWFIGKTSFSYLQEGIDLYFKRLQHYIKFDIVVIPDIKNAKNLTQDQLKTKEGALLLKKLTKSDLLVLLDENGKSYDSVAFAQYIDKTRQQSQKRLIFVVGGAYGFSKEVLNRANNKISLSKMTFSHQMVRLFFVEQLYRAMTILKGEPYHHS